MLPKEDAPKKSRGIGTLWLTLHHSNASILEPRIVNLCSEQLVLRQTLILG
jgi:hypothetical protein